MMFSDSQNKVQSIENDLCGNHTNCPQVRPLRGTDYLKEVGNNVAAELWLFGKTLSAQLKRSRSLPSVARLFKSYNVRPC